MFPDKVMICGVPYNVKFSDDSFTIDAYHFGQISYKNCEITISRGMTEPMQMQTLIHEWVHGALFSIGYDDLRGDEKLVQNLAIAIAQSFMFKPKGGSHDG